MATVSDPQKAEQPHRLQRRFGWMRRLVRGVCRCLVVVGAGYTGFVLIGLFPVNRDFCAADPADGVEIYVTSNGVHAEILMPVQHHVIDWRDVFPADAFRSQPGQLGFVAVGWGDEEFFVRTPTWRHLTVQRAIRALLWPSRSCLHVTMTEPEYCTDAQPIRVSAKQYHELTQYVLDSVRRGPHGQAVVLDEPGYHSRDAFFEALGSYHAFSTCNSWAGRALATAGVPVGWATPLPQTVYLWLPESE